MILLILIRFASSSYTQLSLGETVFAYESPDWTLYELNYDFNSLSRFTRITLSVQQHSTLVLCLTKSSPPQFVASNTRVVAEFVDYDSWFLRSSSSAIVIDSSYLESSETVLVGIGNPNPENTHISYSLIVENSEDALCVNDCSGRGECLGSVCECRENFINYDCSTPAKHIENEVWEVFNVGIGETKYVYFPVSSEMVEIEMRWIGPQHIVIMDWSNNGFFELPSVQENDRFYSVAEPKKDLQITISESRGDYLYMGIFNNDVQRGELLYMSIKIQYLYNVDSVQYFAILMAMAALFVLLWIGSIVIKRAIRRHRERTQIRTSATNVEAIELLSPRMPYTEIKGPSEEICVICLEAYTDNDSVRQLQCGHVFHSQCIDEWLHFNKTCCLCKNDCTVHMSGFLTTMRQPI